MIEIVLVLLFAIGIPVVLWALISSETDDTEVMDRRSAERSARADSHTDHSGQQHTRPGRDENETRW